MSEGSRLVFYGPKVTFGTFSGLCFASLWHESCCCLRLSQAVFQGQMSRWFRSESSGRVTLHFTLSYYIYLHRGQATSSLNIPARGWASFSIGFLVAAFDLATGACWLYLCAALGARVRLSATDLSVADAKLFATVASDVDRAILGCAFYAGLAIGALVFHPGGCYRRMWLPAVLRYVTSVLVLRRLWNAWHFLHCVGAGAIAACFAAMWGVLAFAAVCALLLRRRQAGPALCRVWCPFRFHASHSLLLGLT